MANFEIICEGAEPVYWNGEKITPIDGSLPPFQNWQFQKMICSGTGEGFDKLEHFELIGNEDTGASFYLDKSFSYGDWFLMSFLAVFILTIIPVLIFKIFK